MTAQTNKTVLSFAVETSIGVLPGTPDWVRLEPNDIGTFGSTIATVARNPISNDRMAKKGAISDLDSAVDYTADLTIASFNNFAQGFFFSAWKEQTEVEPTSTTTSAFVHAALSSAVTEGTLIFARNFANSENNGLFVVDSGGTTTSTPVTSTLVAEASPPTGAKFNIAGFEGASGDIELDSSGDLISTTLDFTTLSLQVGQSIYVGGLETINQFATTSYKGLVRIRIIEANKLTLDKRDWTVGAADAGTGKEIHLYIGSFIRNVSIDDADFLEETYTFEGEYSTLEAGNSTVYEYPSGNKPNELTISLPLSDKAGASFAFIGLDTPNPTASQATGNRVTNLDTDAFSTVSDCLRLSLYDSSLSAYVTNFKSLDLTINNNVSPEKVLCTLGAADMNIGDFSVTGSGQVLFSDENIISAVRNNETISVDVALYNDEGALHFDVPAAIFGTASKSFPEDESVLIDVDITAHKDDFFGYVLSCTKFPYVPLA